MDSRTEQEPSDAPLAGRYPLVRARSVCAQVHLAVWLLWAAVLTVLVATGVWGLGWMGYLGALFGSGVGLLFLSALAAGTAKKVAGTFPAFARTASLTDLAPSARDEAAIRLAILCEYGCTSPLAFRCRLERPAAVVGILASGLLEIFAWCLVLFGSMSSALAGANMETHRRAAKAARILLGLGLVAKLRALFRQGVFNMQDLRRARFGLLPSDPWSLWCTSGVDGAIYVLSRHDGQIAVREQGIDRETEVPIDRLSQANLQTVKKARKAAVTRKAIAKLARFDIGWGALKWDLPELAADDQKFVLDATLGRVAFKVLSSWRKSPGEGKIAPVAPPVVRTSRLAAASLLLTWGTVYALIHFAPRLLSNSQRFDPLFARIAVPVLSASLLLGLVAGHMARRQARRQPYLVGERLATWGLIVGYVVVSFAVLFLVIGILE